MCMMRWLRKIFGVGSPSKLHIQSYHHRMIETDSMLSSQLTEDKMKEDRLYHDLSVADTSKNQAVITYLCLELLKHNVTLAELITLIQRAECYVADVLLAMHKMVKKAMPPSEPISLKYLKSVQVLYDLEQILLHDFGVVVE